MSKVTIINRQDFCLGVILQHQTIWPGDMSAKLHFTTERMNASLRELRRKRLYKIAAAYGVVAWLAVQVTDILQPALFLPEWGVRLVLALAIAGFPLALIVAWALEPGGGDTGSVNSASVRAHSLLHGQRLDFLIMAILATFIIGLLVNAPAINSRHQAAIGSVAVLPFVELGENGTGGYLGDGLAGELLNSLASLDGLHVAARTSSFAFREAQQDVREIGQQLGVDAVVAGTLRHDGEQVRITIQLINVADGFNLWSRTYSRKLDDILDLQQEIGLSVASALSREVLDSDEQAFSRPGTTSAAAYQRYLEGRVAFHRRTPESLLDAIRLFEQAVAIDPDYALAYSGVADAHLLRVGYANVPLEQAREVAERAIARALTLDDRLAEAYASLGLLKAHDGQPGAAEQAYRKAIELDPQYAMAQMWLGGLLLDQGRLRAANIAFSRARNLDPLHPVINGNLASSLMAMGMYDAGMVIFQRVLEYAPRSAPVLRQMSGWSADYGRLDRSLELAATALDLDQTEPQSLIAMARSYLWLDDKTAAEHWLQRAQALAAENPMLFHYRAAYYFEAGQPSALDAYASAQAAELEEKTPESMDYKSRQVWAWAGTGRVLMHDYDSGIRLLERALQTDEGRRQVKDVETLTMLAVAYRRSAKEDAARQVIAECEQLLDQARRQGAGGPRTALMAAAVASLDGRRDEALDHLQQAFNLGWRRHGIIEHHLAFDSIRNDDRYNDLLRRMRESTAVMREQLRVAALENPARTATVN
jgi:TolB-like protein/Tfp pilus assembly protein PilF